MFDTVFVMSAIFLKVVVLVSSAIWIKLFATTNALLVLPVALFMNPIVCRVPLFFFFLLSFSRLLYRGHVVGHLAEFKYYFSLAVFAIVFAHIVLYLFSKSSVQVYDLFCYVSLMIRLHL